MGFRDWFTRHSPETVTDAKVLVCSLDVQFEELAKIDSSIYGRFYPSTMLVDVSTIDVLLKRLQAKYDIVHLFCNVLPGGNISDSYGNVIAGTQPIESCFESGTKLLWIANDNPADGYIHGFKARGKNLNLVMTISRNADRFAYFLERLLSGMVRGNSMPAAWEASAPQIPGHLDIHSPSTIFYAGRANVRLLQTGTGEEWRTVRSLIQRFLGGLDASDVSWLTSDEAEET